MKTPAITLAALLAASTAQAEPTKAEWTLMTDESIDEYSENREYRFKAGNWNCILSKEEEQISKGARKIRTYRRSVFCGRADGSVTAGTFTGCGTSQSSAFVGLVLDYKGDKRRKIAFVCEYPKAE